MNTLVFLLNLMAQLGMPAPHVDIIPDPGYVDSQVVGCNIWFVHSVQPDESVVVCQEAKRLIVIK